MRRSPGLGRCVPDNDFMQAPQPNGAGTWLARLLDQQRDLLGVRRPKSVLDNADAGIQIAIVKLSNKGRYAIRALFDIAFYSDGGPTQVKDIAAREGIPPRFLEQIFQDLKRAGIVASKRGPQGGYNLSRSPREVALGDVVRALEGPITLGDRGDSPSRRRTGQETRRVTDAVFADLAAKVAACFDSISIADVCAHAEALGLQRPTSERYVYVI